MFVLAIVDLSNLCWKGFRKKGPRASCYSHVSKIWYLFACIRLILTKGVGLEFCSVHCIRGVSKFHMDDFNTSAPWCRISQQFLRVSNCLSNCIVFYQNAFWQSSFLLSGIHIESCIHLSFPLTCLNQNAFWQRLLFPTEIFVSVLLLDWAWQFPIQVMMNRNGFKLPFISNYQI